MLPPKYNNYLEVLPCAKNYTSKFSNNNPKERMAIKLFHTIRKTYFDLMVEDMLEGHTVILATTGIAKMELTCRGRVKPYMSFMERVKSVKVSLYLITRKKRHFFHSYLTDRLYDKIALAMTHGIEFDKKMDDARKF
jgi:hypothetical protein